MKTLLSILLVAIFFNASIAQNTDIEETLRKQEADSVEGWQKGGIFTLNFSQTSLTNWSAGGQSSITAVGLISLYAKRTKGSSLWENYLDLGYGVLKQGKNGAWWKTDDKIDLTSKYGQAAFGNWYYAGLLNFKTQMVDGYNYPDDSTKISSLLAPGYILIALGLDYKPSDAFGLFIAPVTSKTTIVNNQTLADAGAFGVDAAEYDEVTGELISSGENSRVEIGGYVRAFFQKDVMKNVSFQTKLDLFSNYVDHPENIDVSWEVLVSMQVNEYITASLSTHLLYDHDTKIGIDTNNDDIIDSTGPRTQFKEVIAVGFTYKF